MVPTKTNQASKVENLFRALGKDLPDLVKVFFTNLQFNNEILRFCMKGV